MRPTVTDRDDHVPRRLPFVVLTMLVLFLAGAVSWPGVSAVYSSTTANAGNGIHGAVLDLGIDKRRHLGQTVTIPAYCAAATLSFWLRIQTIAGPGTGTMSVQLLDPASQEVIATLASVVRADTANYQQYTYDLTAYRGRTVIVRFDAIATGSRRTTFIIDDIALTLNTS